MRRYLPLLALSLMLLSLLGCGDSKVEVKNLAVNPDSLYTAKMTQLNTLISDSGLIRYRLTAPVLLIYERKERNQWIFPRGLILRPYDATQGSKVFIRADSAVRRPLQEEWELFGNVRVQGPNGQWLTTKRLLWVRAEQMLSSEDTTNFYVEGKELRGSHFRAKDDLSWYEIYDNKGVFDYDEKSVGTSPTAPPPPPLTQTPSAPPRPLPADTLRRP